MYSQQGRSDLMLFWQAMQLLRAKDFSIRFVHDAPSLIRDYPTTDASLKMVTLCLEYAERR